jgi:tellurite resistance protein
MSNYEQIFEAKNTTEESLSPEEAVAAIAVVSAIADSTIEEVDGEGLAGILWEFEVFAEYSEEEILEIVDELMAIAEEEGVGTLLNTATQSLPEEMVWDGFASGVVMLLDEEELVIPPEKQPYLKKLQEALKLSDEEAQEIIEEVTAAFQEDDEEFLDDEDDTIVRGESN